MNQVLLAALNGVVSKLAKAGGPVAPGFYNVDETVTIRVAGTVEKLDDEVYTPTVDIPLLTTIALFIDNLCGKVQDIQVAKVLDILVESMTAALTADAKANPVIAARLKDIDAAMAKVRSVTAALPSKVRTGKTKVDATLVVAPAGATVVI